MLKVERSISYLKKEKNNSEIPKVLEEVQHIEQAQRLSELKRYRRFDSDDEREKNIELFSAIRNGDLQKIQELFKAGVKVNIIDKNNKDNTPLHYAIEREKEEIAEKLLQEWKADIDAKNNKGDTPLHIATSKGNKKLVQLLLSEKAEVNIKNSQGYIPLDIANDLGRSDIVEILKSQIQPNLHVSAQQPSTQQKRTRTDSEKDKSEDSNPKRRKISSPDPQHMEVDQDEHNQEPDYEGHGTDAQSSVGEPMDVNKGDQKSEGVRSSLHGVVYQMKLSMLFLQAALGSNYSFKLYSEKKDADKFDDVVFKYDKPGEMYRFLQAKHKQDPEKKENKITIGKLLSEDSKNPFNLQKYFVSFRRISKKYRYESIGDLTICTNADFSSDIKGEIDKRFTDITKKETDSILGTGKGKRYKIINSNENEDLVKKLKDASDEYKLAKLLIDVILKKQNRWIYVTSLFVLIMFHW